MINADVPKVEVILVPEVDDFVNPAGVKGLRDRPGQAPASGTVSEAQPRYLQSAEARGQPRGVEGVALTASHAFGTATPGDRPVTQGGRAPWRGHAGANGYRR